MSIHGRHRTEQVNLRLTPREKVRLRALANDKGVSVSEFLRKLAFDEDYRLKSAPYTGLLMEQLEQAGK